jgi:hypothetical protein
MCDIVSRIPLQKMLAELLDFYRVECLPKKFEAFSLSPSPTPKISHRYNFGLIIHDCPVLLTD